MIYEHYVLEESLEDKVDADEPVEEEPRLYIPPVITSEFYPHEDPEKPADIGYEVVLLKYCFHSPPAEQEMLLHGGSPSSQIAYEYLRSIKRVSYF